MTQDRTAAQVAQVIEAERIAGRRASRFCSAHQVPTDPSCRVCYPPLRSQDDIGPPAGAHHGDPTLYERDIKLLQNFCKWVNTVRQWREKDNPAWLPTHPDMLKSRLFWRIRSGKEPLSFPPPTSYSCPWYELVEDGVPHDVWPKKTVWFSSDTAFAPGEDCVSINQDIYTVIQKHPNGSWTVGHGFYRFRLWEGTCVTRCLVDGTVTDRDSECWKIQRAPELEAP